MLRGRLALGEAELKHHLPSSCSRIGVYPTYLDMIIFIMSLCVELPMRLTYNHLVLELRDNDGERMPSLLSFMARVPISG
jgi:hypothetical protein